MNTYFIADNKNACIYQTHKTRQEVLDSLTFNDYDICITCDDLPHALQLVDKGNYQLVNIGDFQA